MTSREHDFQDGEVAETPKRPLKREEYPHELLISLSIDQMAWVLEQVVQRKATSYRDVMRQLVEKERAASFLVARNETPRLRITERLAAPPQPED